MRDFRMRIIDRFLSTLSVVSRVPVKLPFTFDASRMDFHLPLTGIFPALLGLAVYSAGSLAFGVSDAAPPEGPKVLTVVVTLLVQYLGFNLFHLDGLMDTADAFLGSADREKRLLILKDSRVGVYGFFAGLSALALKAALLYCLLPFARDFPAVVFMFPLWGRFGGALVPCMAAPLNPNSLGALTKDARPRRAVAGMGLGLVLWLLLVWGLVSGAVFIGALPKAGALDFSPVLVTVILLCVICPLAAFYYSRLYKKALGGYTGDTLGAAIESAEILSLVTVFAVLRVMAAL